MAGLRVVAVKTHADGNLDLQDLQEKAEKHKDNLAAFMVCEIHFHRLVTMLTISLDYISIYFWCIRGRRNRGECAVYDSYNEI